MAASVLVIAVLATPPVLIAAERTGAGSGPAATGTASPGGTAPGVVGSAGVVRGTTLRLDPGADDARERALGRGTASMMSTAEKLRRAAPPPVAAVLPVPEPAPVSPEPASPVEPTPDPEPAPPAPVSPEPAEPAPVAAASFRVSSFNILGADHTEAGGTRPAFAAGETRMRWAMSLLRSADITVAGLQELELPQHATFQKVAPNWDVFPGMKLSRRALANSIVWDTGAWQFVKGRTIAIPYFYGKPKPMPYVLLRHAASGRQVWFANFHNPASVRGPAAHWRREAVAREIALVNDLSARGTPVVMTGDMNDRAEFFCPVTTRSRMHAANGGSRGAPCRPPSDMGIDWIMGSPAVAFSDYRSVRGGLVSRTSDHPFVWASATIGGAAAR